MSKIDEVRADMVKAMKAKDKDTKETLSMLLAALKNKAIDKPDTGRRDSGNLKRDQADKRDPGYDSCRSYRDHRRMQQASGCSGTVCS